MSPLSRRDFLRDSALAAVGTGLDWPRVSMSERIDPASAADVVVLNPKARVPISLIIDDSTCLVNLAHFAVPQFNEVFPDRYRQPWRDLPREIPDAFVRTFGEWCHDHGVKGKYSVVPYPACVGWVDRFLPGWSKRELEDSLRLVRELIMPDWDIHPEMISHTRVIDVSTGRPFPDATPAYMENWEWSQTRSADELAEYMGYALRVLKNAGLPCEGVTTPGGFGGRNQNNLAIATLQAVRDVMGAEIPHYFRDLFAKGEESVAPRVLHASGLDGPDPRCVVSIIGCTGDAFGGWDGLSAGSVDTFITPDLDRGRLVEVIGRGEPAIMVCHWPGMYFNGQEVGFSIFKEVVRRVHSRYDHLIWMKLSEIARYWAARELTRIERRAERVTFHAPFAAPAFTVRVPGTRGVPRFGATGEATVLREARGPTSLEPGTWLRDTAGTVACFDLPKGTSVLEI